jgi:hypothetical protein
MQPIYVEVSDEITTVIERMKEANDTAIALVVPKGAILLQSIVNLKLAKRAAADHGKELSLITTDKIGKNLATQVGLPVYARLDDENIPEEGPEEEGNEPSVIAGVKIHRYYDEENAKEEEADAPVIDPIIPKQILTEKAQPSQAEPVDEEPLPIITREIGGEKTSPKNLSPEKPLPPAKEALAATTVAEVALSPKAPAVISAKRRAADDDKSSRRALPGPASLSRRSFTRSTSFLGIDQFPPSPDHSGGTHRPRALDQGTANQRPGFPAVSQ